MALELFLVCFWLVKCLIQTDHFAEAMYSLCMVASFADFGKLVIISGAAFLRGITLMRF